MSEHWAGLDVGLDYLDGSVNDAHRPSADCLEFWKLVRFYCFPNGRHVEKAHVDGCAYCGERFANVRNTEVRRQQLVDAK